MLPTHNLHVKESIRLTAPHDLKAQLPMTETANRTVVAGREAISAILKQTDSRLLVVVGPCSIHDPKGALEYATRLNTLRKELEDQFHIVMRVYFEKPRTTVGWKGLIYDPHLDGTDDIQTGLKQARELLLQITEMGLPAATEFLDPVVPQYIADLVSWAAIGARTTESQTHRQMASGLSMPVGFKNGTDGGLQIAIDAMQSAMRPHSFLGIDQDGYTCIVRTQLRVLLRRRGLDLLGRDQLGEARGAADLALHAFLRGRLAALLCVGTAGQRQAGTCGQQLGEAAPALQRAQCAAALRVGVVRGRHEP